MIALHNLEIPYRFPQAVIREAEEAGEVSLKGREDWREIPLITIDPFDAKDHDDAVYAEPDTDAKNAGGHIVTVAIADVAAYVRPGTALDREAYLRGNSVYFPDRVVPMLPERISNDLCSLKEGVNRPALAVRMVIGAGRAEEAPQLPPRGVPLGRKAQLPAGAGGDRRPARRQDRPDPRDRAEAALGRLPHDGDGARQARSARPRAARAEDHPRRQGPGRRHPHPRAARRAPADRGDDDRRQRRGGGDARKAQERR